MHENAEGRLPVPAYLNARAGSAGPASDCLRNDSRFTLREIRPDELAHAIAEEARQGARRVLVCGGDGTISTGAAVAAEHDMELAILPGGTLNHFARRLGIPDELTAALDVAAGEHVRRVDVGFLGDRLFLNTSSVGAYVTFVRLRERMERWLGYRSASALAAVRLLFRLRDLHVRLELEGTTRRYSSRLVFVGVGERGMSTPRFGEPVRDGDRALHLVVVQGAASVRHLVRALAAAARGRDSVHETPGITSHLVDACVVELSLPTVRVSLDGEIHRVRTPLRYRMERSALRVVVPAPVERRDPPAEGETRSD
jgi:diacylglycerol kinase family enzyme